MKLAAVTLARTLAFIETADVNPSGRIFYPDLVRKIVERYNFQVFPQTPEQCDELKGVEFRAGKIGDSVIDTFKIFSTLLVAETRSSTTASKQVIEDILAWSKQEFGLTYESSMVKQWAYVSQVTFYSDLSLLGAFSTPLSRLATKTGAAVSELWQDSISYETTALAIGHDPLRRQNSIASFTLSRRADAAWRENKYFSEAPLPTELHVKLLEEFEADVVKSLP